MQRVLMAFLAGLIVMGGGSYLWLHREIPDPLAPKDEPAPDVSRDILGRKTETVAIGEVVNGIRKLNRLVIFQAYVTATTTTRTIGWFSQSDQTMLTPAFVNYYIDMGSVDANAIRINGNNVYVPRPAIMIERPNIDTRNVQLFNSGVWTNLTSESEKLRLKNNRKALQQLVLRAKMPFLVQAARAGAVAAEEVNIQRMLASTGHPNMIVHVGS